MRCKKVKTKKSEAKPTVQKSVPKNKEGEGRTDYFEGKCYEDWNEQQVDWILLKGSTQ